MFNRFEEMQFPSSPSVAQCHGNPENDLQIGGHAIWHLRKQNMFFFASLSVGVQEKPKSEIKQLLSCM